MKVPYCCRDSFGRQTRKGSGSCIMSDTQMQVLHQSQARPNQTVLMALMTARRVSDNYNYSEQTLSSIGYIARLISAILSVLASTGTLARVVCQGADHDVIQLCETSR